jgi:hypothetical protein
MGTGSNTVGDESGRMEWRMEWRTMYEKRILVAWVVLFSFRVYAPVLAGIYLGWIVGWWRAILLVHSGAGLV